MKLYANSRGRWRKFSDGSRRTPQIPPPVSNQTELYRCLCLWLLTSPVHRPFAKRAVVVSGGADSGT
jgi:hypothetical protein